ncbi:hypothetical protein GWK47_023555 [Chionoecetes opilio]|uniref:Uncharacterized protein n=1 Tax=Chionoecetes opilio TaxID=41210 RepID=A0A8J4XQK7_CHIOP|nr:hypothetical protein GWK47_023555 [Chionoecetes opilio]
MPRYAYQKPVNRLYSYNLGYMHNYYKPLTTYIEKNKEVIESGKRAPSEQPGHQSLAERLKTYPMDGTTYRSRAASAPPARRLFDDGGEVVPWPSKASRAASRARMALLDDCATTAPAPVRRSSVRPMSAYESYEPLVRNEITIDEDDIRRVPLWMKHPYRLPEEDIKVPPHESSIWPESVPHFNLVSSYDTMIGYLGLKQPRMFR